MTSDNAHDRPFAVWCVFRDAPRWWFARGCPPTLLKVTGWTRVLHASVLLGAMGGISSGVASLLTMFMILCDVPSNARLLIPIATFAIVVFVPLLRWNGVSFAYDLWALLYLVSVYAFPIVMFQGQQVLFGPFAGLPLPLFVPESFWAGALTGAALPLLMRHAERRPRQWLPFSLLVGGVAGWIAGSVDLPVTAPDLIRQNWVWLQIPMRIVPFQLLVAIAMGYPFWWSEPVHRRATRTVDKWPVKERWHPGRR